MRLLIPSDGSPSTIRAARTAQDLLGSHHEVEVVTASGVENPAIATAISRVGGPDRVVTWTKPATPRPEAARAVVDWTSWALGLDRPGRVLRGAPGPAICRYAAERPVDVIVIHQQGIGLVKRALVGSVSRYVVEHAPCAVLVVR